MIAPESLAKSGHTRICEILLPVEPPEVYPLLLSRTYNMIEKGAGKVPVLELPGHSFLRYRIHPHVFGNLLIEILIPCHAIGRMKIESGMDTVGMNIGKKFLGIRNEIGVPCPAGPASASSRHLLFPVIVPVHIENKHIGINILLAEIAQNIAEILR